MSQAPRRKTKKRGTRSTEDRFLATLRPRRELIEAIIAYAIYRTDKRRRAAHRPKVLLTRVSIWCQVSQAGILAAYRRHLAYLQEEHPITKRTLTRQVAGIRRLKLLLVSNESRWDRRRHVWIQQHNRYEVTYAGVLWIRRHARSVKIPSFI